jgi:hypothetical protein
MRRWSTHCAMRRWNSIGGWSVERNTFGAIVFQTHSDGKLYNFSQLFLSREIWGVDARILNADFHQEIRERWGSPSDRSWVASGYIEKEFTRAVQNYLSFAETHLLIPSPVSIEAGLIGIKGYAIATDPSGVRGNALHDVTQWRGEADYRTPAWEILAPFFKRMWANCDLLRPAACQVELERQFRNVR